MLKVGLFILSLAYSSVASVPGCAFSAIAGLTICELSVRSDRSDRSLGNYVAAEVLLADLQRHEAFFYIFDVVLKLGNS